MSETESPLQFGPFHIDCAAEALYRGDELVHVTPKSLGILRHLVEQAGALVTRDALFEQHWPGQVVTDHALARCIRELRIALADDALQPRFLQTVHRRGYRFVGHVQGATAVLPVDSLATAMPLFGRDDLRARLAAVVERAFATKQGAVVELCGEAGIGKSALVRAWLRGQQAERCVSKVAFASEDPSAPPFWQWRQCLEALREEPRLAALSLRVDALLAELQRPRSLDESGAREDHFDVRHHLVGILIDCARLMPLLLVLEDAHVASADCLALLEPIAQRQAEAPLIVAVTYRDVGVSPRAALVAALAACARGAPLHERIAVTSLDVAAVTSWLGDALGYAPSASLVTSALRASGGNPLYLRQLLALPASDDDADAPAGWISVPARTLAELIDQRLGVLDDDCRQALAWAAVMGGEFETKLVRRCWPHAAGALDAALARCAVERLVEAAPDEGTWRFEHGVVRERIYAACSKTQREQMHGVVARALETLGDNESAPPFGQLARHFGHAEPTAENHDKAAQYLLLAARHAFTNRAYGEALALCARARSLYDTDLPATSAGASRAAALTALCWRATGDPLAARRQVDEAVALARASGEHDALAEASLTWSELQPAYPLAVTHRERLDAALVGRASMAPATTAKLLARRSFVMLLEGEMAGARDDALAAEQSARRARDDTALHAALGARLLAFVAPADDEARRSAYNEQLAIARRCNDAVAEFAARLARLEHLLQIGPNANAVHAEHLQITRLATQLDSPWSNAARLRIDAGMAIAAGDVAAATQLAKDALSVGLRTSDSGTAQAIALLQLGTLLAMGGSLGDMEFGNEDRAVRNSLYRASAVLLRLRFGDRAGARSLLDQLISEPNGLVDDMTYASALGNLALSCWYLEHAAAAEWLYERLAPYRGRCTTALCYYSDGCASRPLAMIALVLGRTREATELIDEALEVNERMGHALTRADTLVLAQRLEAQRGGRRTALTRGRDRWLQDFLQRSGLTARQLPSGLEQR